MRRNHSKEGIEFELVNLNDGTNIVKVIGSLFTYIYFRAAEKFNELS